jgi:hypothetical protein
MRATGSGLIDGGLGYEFSFFNPNASKGILIEFFVHWLWGFWTGWDWMLFVSLTSIWLLRIGKRKMSTIIEHNLREWLASCSWYGCWIIKEGIFNHYVVSLQGWCHPVLWHKAPSRQVAYGHWKLCDQGLLCDVRVGAWE